MNLCNVCKNNELASFTKVDNLIYWRCQVCEAILLDPNHYVSSAKEKKHYLKHNNKIDENGYKNFLLKLINPIRNKICADDIGLDYGCGYAPALAYILKQDGINIELYDPFFFPNKSVFLRKFNFITCTEVIEHFFNPNREFKKIDSILARNSFLAVMTTFIPENEKFEDWYYRRDPTHVVFYNEKTFEIIASQRKWKTEYPEKNIIIFKKD